MSDTGPAGRHGPGLPAYFGGFWAFLLVAALGAAGLVAGRLLEGDLEASDFVRSRERR
ncbi:hypothetical protein [Streptomyces agglomeratus]|uniref:hypothetical protein n=1 Tax=Streptomyces agglomeratus TaxID=285458 RepID=UPI0014289C23|nr:hypothetical protein [Streptomyces agglomeratus]